MILEALVCSLIVAGSMFMLLAAIGILRLPDLYMRMSATTKASTFGLTLIALAACITHEDPGVKGRVVAIIAFICLTNPVSSHMIGRAGYLANVPLWSGTVIDQMKDYFKGRIAHL